MLTYPPPALAADVLVYIGALDGLFPAISRVLKPRGMFAFSVEALPEGNQSQETTQSRIYGYTLENSGRYRHQAAYLTEQAIENTRRESAFRNISGNHEKPSRWLDVDSPTPGHQGSIQ